MQEQITSYLCDFIYLDFGEEKLNLNFLDSRTVLFLAAGTGLTAHLDMAAHPHLFTKGIGLNEIPP